MYNVLLGVFNKLGRIYSSNLRFYKILLYSEGIIWISIYNLYNRG